MSSPKKLFLLDAMALVYRAYFAFSNNHRVNSKGLNTSAIFGFTNTLLEVLKKEKPTHIAVVFDTQAKTVRHDAFPAYKAQREEVPDDIITAIPYIKRLIEGFNIPVLYKDGYEADDVIGTLAKEAEKKGFITYMMTPDKDYGQLVSDHIFMYKPARLGNGAEILGPKEVCEKWQIKSVDQLIDVLGLMGDAVDNIPGIPGVGEKTAIQLVKDYGTIENLLQNTASLKGKLKEKVENNKEMAIQSKQLATIITDVPVPFEEDKLIMEEPNKEALKELFTELEFRRLAQQILGEDINVQEQWNSGATAAKPATQAAPKPKSAAAGPNLFDEGEEDAAIEDDQQQMKFHNTIQNTSHQYHLINTPQTRITLVNELSKQKSFCFDTETTGLDVLNVELVGLSFSFKPQEAYYIPVPASQTEAQAIVNEFKPIFENETIEKIGQNIKYDLAVLKNYGVDVRGPLFDTMVAHFLIRPEMRHGMDVLAETYLDYSPVSIEALIGKKGKNQLSMRDVPVDQIKDYAAEDADITYQLKDKFVSMLNEGNAKKLFADVEVPLIPVLAAMEREGIRLDTGVLKQFSAELTEDIIATEKDIHTLAGTPFNISSPKQVGEILFEVLKIVDKPKKTKTGQYATGEDILAKLESKHDIVRRILDYRELVKLKNTYVDTLPELVDKKTNRIHTSYNQVVAVTGRLSSDNPNLQNIPIRTPRGREIRKAFIPRDENFVLLSADYSQIELRIMAELSKDKNMIEAFLSGQDIHAATAAKVYGVELDKVTSDMRRNAKMVNFGIIYGISAFGLAERLNISRTEAKNIIDSYFQQYSQVKEYMDSAIEQAREKGYVETILGRRRYLRDINSANATVRGYAERNAINAPIQGSAADMIKIAMINIHKEFEKQKFKSRMLLQVHDELVFDAHKDEVETIKPIIENLMKNALPMQVPAEVGMGTGKNWLEAH